MIALIKVLHSIIYVAGYLAIVVLASVISYNGKPMAGLGIILTFAAVSATLLIASAVVNRRHKPRQDTPRPTARTPLNPTNMMPALLGR